MSVRERVPVFVVGEGVRGRAWRALVASSPACEFAGSSRRFPGSIESIVAAHPGVRFIAALPPRAARSFAELDVIQGIPALLESPLHATKYEPGSPSPTRKFAWGRGARSGGEESFQAPHVAHGLTVLAGVPWLRKVLDANGPTSMTFELRGLPSASSGDVWECLVHAMSYVRRVVPSAVPERATNASDGVLEADFRCDSGRLKLLLRTHGQQASFRFASPSVEGSWSWRPGVESMHLRPLGPRTSSATGDAVRKELEVGPVDERLLRAWLDAPSVLDTLEDADDVLARAAAVREALDRPLPIGVRPLRHARRLVERGDAVESVLGLLRETPMTEGRAELSSVVPPVPPGHLETFAFRAGLKPVCFLTSRPSTVERDVARFGEGVFVEKRERFVAIGAQDEWKDDRTSGEPWVELYVSRDPALAQRAMSLQADGDPTKNLAEIGALLGYPDCCVQSFLGTDDRSNNTRNRYVIAARTRSSPPWPWELNDLPCMVVPFFPCRFDCPKALDWARRTFAEMRQEFPAEVDALAKVLAWPVLYFDHERQLLLEGGRVVGSESSGIAAEFDALRLGPDAPADFASWATTLSGATRVLLDDDRLVFEGPGVIHRFRRTDPGLGFVAAFG